MKKNESEYWDSIWNLKHTKENDTRVFNRNMNSILWQRMYKIIVHNFGKEKLNNLQSIEIGAGTGEFSALLQHVGIHTSLLDYSEESIFRSKEFFKNNSLRYKEHINCDALKIKSELSENYDITCSFGVAEHFKGEQRVKILKAHYDLLKPGGLFFISVPNKLNPPYMMYKTLMEIAKKWTVEEFPFTPWEMSFLLKKLKITNFDFFGDSFKSSLRWLYFIPAKYEHKINNRFNFFTKKANLEYLLKKPESGLFLDKYFAYTLVVYGKKLKL